MLSLSSVVPTVVPKWVKMLLSLALVLRCRQCSVTFDRVYKFSMALTVPIWIVFNLSFIPVPKVMNVAKRMHTPLPSDNAVCLKRRYALCLFLQNVMLHVLKGV